VGAIVALCGGGLMLAGLFLPWVSVSLGAEDPSSGFDLLAIWIPTVLAALASVGLTLAWWWSRRERFAVYAALPAGFLCLFAISVLLGIEASGSLLPLSFLPETLRRSTGVLSAGGGLWISLAGAVAVVFATSGLGRWQFHRHSWSHGEDRRKLGILALLLAFTAFIGWLRYQPWVASSALGDDLGVSGQAAPWVGPASLFALFLLVGAFVLLVFARFQVAGLVTAGAGWLISFLAAMSVIVGESLARLRLDALLEGSAVEQGVTFHADLAAWVTYLCGILLAALGGFLVCWRRYQWEGD
jgi:hypothetical protein